MGRARKSRVDSKVKIQLDKWEDHRPFFTWWVSTVQVLVLIFALVDNGFADFGLDIKPYRRTVQERYVYWVHGALICPFLPLCFQIHGEDT